MGVAKKLPLWTAPEPAPTAVTVTAPGSVRVSLTDRCDLACLYCRPSRSDGYLDSRLDESGWRSMLDGLAEAGVRRVRFTGGEPLLYRALEEVVAHAARIGFEDIALTTNATRLAARAPALQAAGLQRVTVSLDSLDPGRFARLTRGGRLAEVRPGSTRRWRRASTRSSSTAWSCAVKTTTSWRPSCASPGPGESCPDSWR
jgi:GTP 3',8-cyclase